MTVISFSSGISSNVRPNPVYCTYCAVPVQGNVVTKWRHQTDLTNVFPTPANQESFTFTPDLHKYGAYLKAIFSPAEYINLFFSWNAMCIPGGNTKPLHRHAIIHRMYSDLRGVNLTNPPRLIGNRDHILPQSCFPKPIEMKEPRLPEKDETANWVPTCVRCNERRKTTLLRNRFNFFDVSPGTQNGLDGSGHIHLGQIVYPIHRDSKLFRIINNMAFLEFLMRSVLEKRAVKIDIPNTNQHVVMPLMFGTLYTVCGFEMDHPTSKLVPILPHKNLHDTVAEFMESIFVKYDICNFKNYILFSNECIQWLKQWKSLPAPFDQIPKGILSAIKNFYLHYKWKLIVELQGASGTQRRKLRKELKTIPKTLVLLKD